jgi:SdpC family antimicrobial peptide
MYRNHRARIAFAIAFAIALVIGMSAPPPAVARSESGSAAATVKFDGETLFSAIFFGTGPAAALLPSRAFPEPTNDQARTIVAGINAADPAFFSRFAADVRSGDRLVIREALNNAARMLELVVQQAYPATTSCDPTVDPSCTPCDPTIDPSCPSDLGFVLAVHAVIAIAIDVAADFVRVVDFVRDYNIYYQYDLWRTQYFYREVLMDQASQLASDAFIDAVAKAFGS